MSIKTFNNKFNLINSRIKYGTDGGINIDQNALVVNPLNGQVGINNLNPQYNLDVCGNTNVNGLINYYGNNINTQFYPALNPYSYAPKALSRWTITGSGNSPKDVVWSPELGLFALCSNTASSPTIFTSPDGINWTGRTTPAYGAWGITWARYVNAIGTGLFVALSTNGVMTSPDGITWTTGASVNANDWQSVAWSQEKQLFVAVAITPSVNSQTVMVSSNGTNWTSYTPPVDGHSVIYVKDYEKFYAIGSTGIMSSPDGINWTRTSSISSVNPNIIWSPTLKIFLASNLTTSSGSFQLATSPDTITWTNVSTPLSGIDTRAITWSPELGIFLAIGNGSSITTYSPNGSTWTLAPSSNPMRRVVWSPELGIFVAVINSGNRTQASSLKGRIPTSYNVFDSSYNNINELGLWNFQSLSKGAPVTKSANFSVVPGENIIVVDNSSSNVVATLPTASQWPGLELTIKTIQNRAVTSVSSNVVQLNGTGPSTSIVPATAGSWVNLVSDGTNWIIMNS